jgi:hypothetical protein
MAAVVLDMSMSLDGFVTGPGPREGAPLGEGGQRLHEWMFSRRAGPGGPEHDETADVNGAVARELFATTGAVLMGRRMSDLGIGPWGDTPFPVPCFVLTHQPHEDLVMASGISCRSCSARAAAYSTTPARPAANWNRPGRSRRQASPTCATACQSNKPAAQGQERPARQTAKVE